MARKKPTVILENTDEDTGKSEQILEGDTIFMVFYENTPISIKNFNKHFDYPGARYKRTAFTNPAHAYNLKNKLNNTYKTDKFNVKIIDDASILRDSNSDYKTGS
ncbi:hypothetical protein PBI_SCTP2_174 [Salicola phage SCTP-2]|nr:hypothetical protein PBI_SCTP2_174 [Salicola phage SCTP-2]